MAVMAPVVLFSVFVNVVIPVALLGILQYFLCRMESPWPGRVLPILSGVIGAGVFLLLLFNMVNFVRMDMVWWMLLLAAVVLSLPAALYIIIYRSTRRSRIVKRDMDKMSIQDLE